ncbi:MULTISPECIES: glycosyltransferase [unclassified Lactobacillus]|uniref:glycosyltransferase n=1 Tax=unclassified Lactobacillus TaxID=2620435 RepID=UPI000EFDAEFD|nr:MULTISPECIES: glycosyltransferase [unclassified Lactobacillus]RMC25523.1 glycosyltransferase family 4 protein [Lactobacillus sp. ESL0247]RMC29427.1 glycosyltransferase family 4 protein [Lactobacillus sp. ESL0246]RMC33156.1 glycosyltransferase family 4 protein [Lactobacillus sp. ESL0245]
MKVLHVNAGLEEGGGLTHIINLLREAKIENQDFELLCLAQGPVAYAAQAASIPVFVLGARSRYDLGSLKRLVTFINQGNYDIVHTHGARANLFLSLIKAKIKAKWCVTVHSDPYLDFANRGLLGHAFTVANMRALKKADAIFAVTQKFAQLLITKGQIIPEKVHVIYNGIFFHENQYFSSKEDHVAFNIINVARTEKVKGQELLLKAMKRLNKSNIHLYIAGDGSELITLKKLVQDLKLESQVTFEGFLTHQQLEKLYHKMDLAVLSSYSESFPLVLLEASDNLVPIMSTNVGDIRMMIPDERHGFVAQIGDLDSITQTLKSAINLPAKKLTQMALCEKKYLAHNFSLDKQLLSLMGVYHSLLKVD